MTYLPASERYDVMTYRTCGRSGLRLPLLSLGLWHNFGDYTPMATQREIVRTAFDLGIAHFDLANNYGPPYGSAEVNFDGLPRPCIGWHFVGHLKKDPHPDRARNGHDRNPVKEKPVSTNTIESENSAGCGSTAVQGQERRH